MQDWPPNVLEAIQRQVSQFGRTGSTKIYAVPDLGAPLALGAPITTSQPQTITFRENGVLIAMYGQELSGTAPKFATTRVRVQIGGSEDLFTDGQSGVFLSLLSLFGGAQNWYPIWRRVTPGVRWVVTYQNLDTVATATPSAQFGFLGDADIARLARSGA